MATYFFPTPYEDELLHSLIARYHIYSGNPGHIHTIEDLFGSRYASSSIEFQGNLDQLCKNLPTGSKLNWSRILYNHTLFPYYGAFVPMERAVKAMDIMRDGNASRVYNMLGLAASGQKKHSLGFFRHCSKCINDDIEEYGETYWHRIHQIPESIVCTKHNEYIRETCYPVIGANRQEYKVARGIELKENNLDLSDFEFSKLKLLAETMERLLSKEYTLYNPSESRQVLMKTLILEGLASPYGMIHQSKLQNIVVDFWSDNLLVLLGHQIEINNSNNWLSTLVRGKRRISNPISNILLLQALHIDIDDFLSPEPEVEDFKTSWINRMVELAKNGESIRSISRTLQASTKTIRRELELLNIDVDIKYNGGGRHVGLVYTETVEYMEKLKRNRERWSRLREEFPDKGRYELKEKDEVLFRWLLKYDKEWLFENSELKPDKSSKLDDLWRSRDQEYIKKIEEVVEEMKNGTTRVTISAVASRLGIKGWLPHGLKNLTMINGYLKEEVETTEEYHIRKIKWAIDKMEREGINVNKSNLIKISGVNNKYILSMEDEVRKILSDKGYGSEFYI